MSAADPQRHVYSSASTAAGAGLFASQSYLPGEEIFTIKRSLLAVPDTPHLPSVCSNCFLFLPGDREAADSESSTTEVPRNLKYCTGCKVVKYCSKKCQLHSWKSSHKFECKLYARLYPQILPGTVRAVTHLLLRRQNDSISDVIWSSLLGLISHIEHFRHKGGSRWEGICLMSKGAKIYSGTDLDEVLVRELYCRVIINSLTLVTPTFDPLGICIDPLAATTNHSCDPNAVVVFDGPRLSFRSIKKIVKHEEVTISYVDCTNPYQRRQEELSDRYFFCCACTKCQDCQNSREDTFLGDAPDLVQLGRAENRAFTLLGEANNLNASLAGNVLQEALQVILDWKAVWPIDRQPWPSIRQQLIVSLLARGKWVSALTHMLKIYFYIDPLLFPQSFHPVRVVHNWTLFRTLLLISSISSSDPEITSELDKFELDYGTIIWALLTEIEGNIAASHGRDSTLALLIRRKFDEVRVDMTHQGTGRVLTSKHLVEKEWSKLRAVANGTE